MMRGWAIIVMAWAVGGAGCKHLQRDDSERQAPPPRPPSSRGNSSGIPPASIPAPHWLDGPPSSGGDLPPNPDAGATGTPTRNDPRGPNFNLQGEIQGTLAGYVEGPDGRKLRGVLVEVEPVGATVSTTKPIVAQTDEQGYFLIRALKTKQTYILTAHTTRDGETLGGQVYAKTPNVHVRLPLIEGLSLGSGRPASVTPNPFDTPPPSAVVPPARTEPPATIIPPSPPPANDGSWSPLGPNTVTPPVPTPTRPDLMTDGPQPGIRPPATNIPPPSNIPAPSSPAELPPPLRSNGTGGTSQSRFVRPKSDFVLVDTTGRSREFPSGRPDDLILLDFMTTTCVPCKKAVPVLKDIQSRYGTRGLEVVGVVCDETDTPQRRAIASAYQRTNGLNYLLYVEPGSRPGKLMDRFGVEFYPTLVLISGSGDVLWKGDPRDRSALEGIITERLGR